MIASLATYWRRLAAGPLTSLTARALTAGLIPPALVYSLLQRLRAARYRSGSAAVRSLPRPVVSIGNLTVGGTGKTPVAAYIARLLIDQGLCVAVLSRGYGGTLEGRTALVSDGTGPLLSAAECGDEPFLLASTVPGLAVVIGADRYLAGCLALERLKPDVFLLDDGFQHLRLHRDLNILLLDYERPFGNGWTLPAGLLREPLPALQRADLIIETRCPRGAQAKPVSNIPTITARHDLADALPLAGGVPIPLSDLCGRKAVACAGIADPEFFFNELRSHGIDLVSTFAFADHAGYSVRQISSLADALRTTGASILLTTEKDGVKLHDLPEELARMVYLVRLKLVVPEPSQLTRALRNLLQ